MATPAMLFEAPQPSPAVRRTQPRGLKIRQRILACGRLLDTGTVSTEKKETNRSLAA
jgi:hypothetical protein